VSNVYQVSILLMSSLFGDYGMGMGALPGGMMSGYGHGF
jgi:hypothetical protein